MRMIGKTLGHHAGFALKRPFIPSSAVRRKSLNVWSSILAPEARQIIAGGS
jgi:hypothetical protein